MRRWLKNHDLANKGSSIPYKYTSQSEVPHFGATLCGIIGLRDI